MLRSILIGEGTAIDRPQPKSGDASESLTNWQQKIERLVVRLSEAERADTEAFLREMLQILPLVGLNAFEVPKVVAAPMAHTADGGTIAQSKGELDTIIVPAQKVMDLKRSFWVRTLGGQFALAEACCRRSNISPLIKANLSRRLLTLRQLPVLSRTVMAENTNLFFRSQPRPLGQFRSEALHQERCKDRVIQHTKSFKRRRLCRISWERFSVGLDRGWGLTSC
jgi:hypothetical protein